MIKNIIAGLMCLFCINMLFNKAAVNRLEREIKELETEHMYLQEKLLWEENYIDSLERVIIDYKLNTNTNR
tara:strand:+ start:120 stop:332 length:213 start_codon:yes stop_codon:yes gene_type:complete